MKKSTIILALLLFINITVLALLLFINITVTGQNIIGVLDYMKVDDQTEYLEVEKLWQKIHEVRLTEDAIIGRSVFKVMFKTDEDPYNFVTVSFYDSFSKLNKAIPDHIYKLAYPEKTEDEWDAFIKRKDISRKVLSSSIFQQEIACSSRHLDSLGKIYVINEIRVKPRASKEYVALNEEIYKPMYEEAIRNNTRTAWSLWAKWSGEMEGHQYLSADGYISLDQMEEVNYLEYFEKVHPDKDIDKISKKTKELRTLTNSEMWQLVYRVLK